MTSQTDTKAHSWDTDWTTMQKDVTDYQAAVDKLKQDKIEAHQKFLDKLAAEKDPESAMLMFLYYIGSSSKGKSNMMGVDADTISIQGQRLKTSADVTQLTNDLQNITNGTGPEAGDGDIKKFADHLDDMLNEFKNNKAFQDIFNDDTGSSLSAFVDNFTNLRHTVYVEGDSSGYNPTQVPNPDETGRTYYFDPAASPDDPKGYISSFAEMKKHMGEQGDPKQATEAGKALSDAFVTLGGVSQGVNSALNETITQLTNYDKNFQAFYSACAQNTLKMYQTATGSYKQQ